jgi:hypothetical protein
MFCPLLSIRPHCQLDRPTSVAARTFALGALYEGPNAGELDELMIFRTALTQPFMIVVKMITIERDRCHNDH